MSFDSKDGSGTCFMLTYIDDALLCVHVQMRGTGKEAPLTSPSLSPKNTILGYDN